MTGAPDLEYVEARATLLDVLLGLGPHLGSVVLVGAQAIYVRVGEATTNVAPYTTDADLAVDPDALGPAPDLSATLEAVGLVATGQPGAWRSASGISIDIMVPEQLAGRGRRGADLGPHGRVVARRATGLEASLVDRSREVVAALDPDDRRTVTVWVAGSAALLVAKLHKLQDRAPDGRRLADKDSLDVVRLLRGTQTDALAEAVGRLFAEELSRDVTSAAVDYLGELFGEPGATGAQMAARAVQGLDDPAEIAASAAILASELLRALSR